MEFEPFYGIHDSRYAIYWMTLTSDGYQRHLDSVALVEKAASNCKSVPSTVVIPGEQQPKPTTSSSRSAPAPAILWINFWRDAQMRWFLQLSVLHTKALRTSA
jgi:hypothetical protein